VLEDRWLLSRLATVTEQVTKALDGYEFADAARTLYDFAWDEFCSFYVEMVKTRLGDAATRPAAQRLLAHALDILARLLHPMAPFVTEEIWQRLGELAHERGFPKPKRAADSVMIATWPKSDASRRDAEVEARFARFQQALVALRDIRMRNNIPPKETISFSVRAGHELVDLLRPMEPYFQSMANARATAWGENATPPATSASAMLEGGELFVDLANFIDVGAEIARHEKQRDALTKAIAGKETKLANANFVDRAPAQVVQQERDSLAQLKTQLASVSEALEKLRKA
jgi:valyl-tRNA synthetase